MPFTVQRGGFGAATVIREGLVGSSSDTTRMKSQAMYMKAVAGGNLSQQRQRSRVSAINSDTLAVLLRPQ